ncbi:hypothetical protein [Streptomyces sp. SM14]|uniref:hypothetical protein n=1 Tax=Streptomyces sp. SM14 TaxID=1736045 RepID=UPI000CD4F47F|nr:hypothetical protein [Streptomyces sp. SM14]
MDPTGPIARRFPLVARARPACAPLAQRVAGLTRRARAAAQDSDLAAATSVHNLSALLASDVGDHHLARAWCRDHAHIYLHATPLPAPAARFALEPLVNLARLHTRAGRGHLAYELLSRLYRALKDRASVEIDGLRVPGRLTTSPEAHAELHRWLWSALLAEGGRALASTGRWNQALLELRTHKGIGRRMLDGRQIAVIAHLTQGDTTSAARLVHDTAPGNPSEDAVTACLTHLVAPSHGTDRLLLDRYHRLPTAPGTATFDVRLGLTALDGLGHHPEAEALARQIAARAAEDGYAARDILQHPPCTDRLPPHQVSRLQETMTACALGHHQLPAQAHAELRDALTLTAAVIHTALAAAPTALTGTVSHAPKSHPH